MRRTAFSLTVGAMCAAGGLLIVQHSRPDLVARWRDTAGRLAGGAAATDLALVTPLSTPGRADGTVAVAPAASPHPRPAPAVSGRLSAAPASVNRPLFPLQPRQVVADGCCGGAWWSADSTALHYIDRPPGSAATAIYAAPVWPPGGVPSVLDTTVAVASGADRYVIRPAGDVSIVRDLTDGREWPLPTGGRPVRLTPDGSRAVWWDAWGGRADVDNLVRIYGADVHGADVRELVALFGATVPACMPDSPKCLVIGRPVKDQALFVLGQLDVVTGHMIELARGTFLADAALSPDGRWVAFTLSLNRERPERNGVFLAPTFIEAIGRIRKLDFEGAYRWRAPNRLVYVPMQPEAGMHVVWELDAEQGAPRRLIGPEAQLRIANNDWSIAPDGATMAWLDERGRGLWAVDLP